MPSEVALQSYARQRELRMRAEAVAGPDATWDELDDVLTESERAELLPALCLDCAVDTMANREYYMVRDEVWERAGMVDEHRRGYLCIGCLEQRIGRRLTPRDFADVLVNKMFREASSARLRSRLRGLRR